MENAILIPSGKEIKKRFADTDRTQAWFIKQMQGTTGLYLDRSYMHKIQTGQLATPEVIQAVRDISDLSE